MTRRSSVSDSTRVPTAASGIMLVMFGMMILCSAFPVRDRVKWVVFCVKNNLVSVVSRSFIFFLDRAPCPLPNQRTFFIVFSSFYFSIPHASRMDCIHLSTSYNKAVWLFGCFHGKQVHKTLKLISNKYQFTRRPHIPYSNK